MEACSRLQTDVNQDEDIDTEKNLLAPNSEGRRSGADYERAAITLSSLFSAVKEPLPEKIRAKDITERAQKLIDNLNAKRKHDTQLIEEYRQALEAQVQKSVNTLEQHIFQMYETQQAVIESKLQELFAILDRVAVSETELDNFKHSFSMLYAEMQNIQ